jgi:hypothetical protein
LWTDAAGDLAPSAPHSRPVHGRSVPFFKPWPDPLAFSGRDTNAFGHRITAISWRYLGNSKWLTTDDLESFNNKLAG